MGLHVTSTRIVKDEQWRSPWLMVPLVLALLGAVGIVAGAFQDTRQLGFSYLLAFMFGLGICLGSLFLVIVHHLFDAGWSVPIRRLLEHLAFLAPVLCFLFIPLAILAPSIYPWMTLIVPDHALLAKQAYLNKPFFYLRAIFCFAVWSGMAFQFRSWSLRQDLSGDAVFTRKMRCLAAAGIFLFAITLTMAAIDWMKSLQYQWFSTMYGVYYFASSVWLTLATIYVIALVLRRTGHLAGVLSPSLFYYLGTLLFAFTVFYAYIHFSQFFIIWNANLPEETFWYVLREKGTWRDIGLLLIFGHFFLPFLTLLRIDAKLSLLIMVPMGAWCWLMQYADLSFNIMPVLHPNGFVIHWMDLACLAFILGICGFAAIRSFLNHPPYPIRDPRLKEALTEHEIPPQAEPGFSVGGNQ